MFLNFKYFNMSFPDMMSLVVSEFLHFSLPSQNLQF